MYRAHTVSVGIAEDPEMVYTYASNPANLPSWAPGFVQSIEEQGAAWIAKTTLGEVTFRFVPANGTGSEVLFTLLQLPGVTDEQFQADLDTVRADLNKLRTILEHRFGSAAAL